jgi:hypothetical protein
MSEHTCPVCGTFFLEAVLSVDPIPTMDTDKMLQPLGGKDCVTGERIEVVHVDDCRKIELEKLELARKVSTLERELLLSERKAAAYLAASGGDLADAERWRYARTIFAHEDIDRAVEEMRGSAALEEENTKTDAAIDAKMVPTSNRAPSE